MLGRLRRADLCLGQPQVIVVRYAVNFYKWREDVGGGMAVPLLDIACFFALCFLPLLCPLAFIRVRLPWPPALLPRCLHPAPGQSPSLSYTLPPLRAPSCLPRRPILPCR